MGKKEKRRKRRESKDIQARLRSNVGRLLEFGSHVFSDRAVAELQLRGHQDVRASHLSVVRNMNANGARITELARRAGMTKQAMGQLVRELRGHGYLELAADPVDRRAKVVTFTESGQRLARDAADSVAEAEGEFKRVVGKRGMKELRRLLARVVDEFDGS